MKFNELLYNENNYFEEEKKQLSSLLSILLILSMVCFAVLFLSNLISKDELLIPSLVLVSFQPLYFSLLILNRKGYNKVARTLYVTFNTIGLSVMAWFGQGVEDVAIVGCVINIFIAALLSGYFFALIISVFTIIAIWIMVLAIHTEFIEPHAEKVVDYCRDYTVVIIFVVAIIWLYTKKFRLLYNNLRSELDQHTLTEEKLKENEKILIEKNNDITQMNIELKDSNQRILQINKELQNAKQKIEESNSLKTAFLQNISHEIRTPMNGIIGFTDLLINAGASEETKRDYAKIINSSCMNLVSVVNNILDISKIEAGVIEIAQIQFDVNQMLAEIETFYTESAYAKNLEFAVTCQIQNPNIISDRNKIYQVLSNVVNNAIKFTQKGFVKIEVKQQDKSLVFAVKDSGIGIKEENQEIIFERFHKLERGLNKFYDGAGLGLSIVRGILECMGGEIHVESIYSKGSTFTFTIPVQFVEIQKEEVATTTNTLQTWNLNILIAEDEDVNYKFVKEIFKKSNSKLVRAKNGAEAIEIFTEEQDFDLILMDLKMPIMDGYEASRIIRRLSPSTPIVAFTAFTEIYNNEIHEENLFDDFITKPIVKKKLLERIAKLMKLDYTGL